MFSQSLFKMPTLCLSLLMVLSLYGCVGNNSNVDFNKTVGTYAPENISGDGKGIIILKLDDMRINAKYSDLDIYQGWIDVYHYLNEQNIHAGFGIISEHVSRASKENVSFIRQLIESGHEVWHHGWDHDRDGFKGEFCGHDYKRQKEHFEKSLDAVAHVYGITMQSFGTPYNCSDATLTQVFEEQSRIKVFMFGDDPLPNNALNLDRWVKMEMSGGQPNYDYFIEQYNAEPNKAYYVLQGHPKRWTKGSLELKEFKKIIEFLMQQGHQFMTPFEYYEYVNTATL